MFLYSPEVAFAYFQIVLNICWKHLSRMSDQLFPLKEKKFLLSASLLISL